MRFHRRAALLVALVLAGCPATSGRIDFFRADPLFIVAGQSVQLAWQATAASGCTLTPDVGAVGRAGATLVQPQVTTTWTLSCDGAKAEVTVTVRAAVRIDSFGATPAQGIPEAPVQLSWVSSDADTCAITPGVGAVVPSGSTTVTPAQTTSYTLTCKGSGPDAVSTTTVTVVPVSSLAAPTDVAVTAQDGALRVTWTQAAGSSAVYFAEVPGLTAANLDTLPGRVVFRAVSSPFVITGLVNGRAYFLRVAAVSGAVESAWSAEVSGTPLGLTSPDPYFSEQWHLTNVDGEDVNVLPVWASGVKGEGVKVAIVDEGVDLAHEDLRQNVATGQSHDYLGNAAVALAEHGTCVAGLLAARDVNGVGLRGVAPRAQLRSFNLLQDLTSANEHDAMVRQQDVVAISNNSWGDAWDNSGLLTFADPLWLSGVTEGATTGRGGKGVVYFWAAGNGADPAQGPVDDSNFDGQANSRFVLTVGGVGRDGKRPLYAEPGANVLVAAPTEGDDGLSLVTTDITGSAGYNSGTTPGEHRDANYSSTMNGTSGSTPVAAGVGALVLQVRPELSYRDVRRVLALSARKCDASSPGWSDNGARLHVHHDYGFGVVDATAAVALARTITPVGPELNFESPLALPAQAVPDANASGVSSSLTIANSGLGHVEVVEIEVSVAHARSGDLELTLSRTGGATDLLHPPHGCLDPGTGATRCSALDAFVFTSVRHLDEPADGVWTLTVKDLVSGTTGTFHSWKLRLYGRP